MEKRRDFKWQNVGYSLINSNKKIKKNICLSHWHKETEAIANKTKFIMHLTSVQSIPS